MMWTVIKTFFVRMIAGCILAALSLDRFGTPVGIIDIELIIQVKG